MAKKQNEPPKPPRMVTPEMRDRGAEVIFSCEEFYVAWVLAERVYQAMERERVRKTVLG